MGSEFISWRSKVGVAASTEISFGFFFLNFVNFPRETNAINQVFDFFIKQNKIVIKCDVFLDAVIFFFAA